MVKLQHKQRVAKEKDSYVFCKTSTRLAASLIVMHNILKSMLFTSAVDAKVFHSVGQLPNKTDSLKANLQLTSM